MPANPATPRESSRALFVRQWREADHSARILDGLFARANVGDEKEALFDGHFWTKKKADEYAKLAIGCGGLLMLVPA